MRSSQAVHHHVTARAQHLLDKGEERGEVPSHPHVRVHVLLAPPPVRDGEPKVGEVLVVLEEVSGVWILRVNHVRDAVRLERLLVRRRADVSDVERPAVGKLEDGGYILVEATRSGLILETARGWGRWGGGALTPSCRS